MSVIQNDAVFGLAESIYRSGYPMMVKPPSREKFKEEVCLITQAIDRGDMSNPHIKRAVKLANARGGGHDQFMTGIIVSFDLTISNKAWVEAERYTFLNFISSMSTMHRVSEFKICECCNQYTSEASIAEAEKLQRVYLNIDGNTYPERKKEAYLNLLYNLPSGFELTAAMTTNYRCLKNIYAQRREHRLPDWHVICDWIEALPLSKELIYGGIQ